MSKKVLTEGNIKDFQKGMIVPDSQTYPKPITPPPPPQPIQPPPQPTPSTSTPERC